MLRMNNLYRNKKKWSHIFDYTFLCYFRSINILSPYFIILFYSVLGEVGAAHEVGGWHAFFACELDLVEVDVAIEDCDFKDFFAVAN